MVGVDQAQIDKILAGASSDDPEARLDTLEKELDFVKTSIKRLLIDLRERMNELDNPFTTAAASYAGNRFEPPDAAPDAGDADADEVPDEVPAGLDEDAGPESLSLLADSLKGISLPADPGAAPLSPGGPAPLLGEKPAGKLKLQKVHRLFAWVHQGCCKYGREHMTIMIDAYRSMGYITDEVADQIREIMRMAPDTRRDVSEIGPNEFVSELYVLNRILDPNDSTLDRDMIEVLMLTHGRPGEQDAGTSSRERDTSDTWIELLDRI
ncbi:MULTISPECIES: hypothetical protein [unclassified Methanoculleus]|jgi:hypothetical protein|uniref:hypothetical protein n=1 Tax=unclassified Methanoculleus TaxID=2619537 RepID=UPI0025F79A8C|nr:hypothetical protein [Methanoculleus sp. UBA377]